MSGIFTVLSAGGATVPASGAWTALGLKQVQSLLDGSALIVPNSSAPAVLAVPPGQRDVVLGQGTSATVTGGDANTAVASAGALDYSGGAALVVGSTGTGSIADAATNAVIDVGGGDYTVQAGASGQVVQVDNGASATLVGTASGQFFLLGDPGGPSTLQGSGVTTLFMQGSGDLANIDSTGNTIADSAGNNTIFGSTGTATVSAAAGDLYASLATVSEFIGSTGAQTVFGGTGADTVFNTQGGSIIDVEGSGSNHVFVGGSGSNTIWGNGSGVVFGGSGHTLLVLNTGNDVFEGGNGGSDSIWGGSVTPTIFGGSNEDVQVFNSRSAIEIAQGSNTTIDGSLGSGGNAFFANSATGNTTLIGSLGVNGGASAADNFMLTDSGAGPAHTLTIENWHTGDGLFLTNYSAADIQTMDTAINSGGTTFVLSDGTTVSFQGNHPIHATGGVAF